MFFIRLCFLALLFYTSGAIAQPSFKAVGFYTGKNDPAHISFVHEANQWFAALAKQHHFVYDSTGNWANLNNGFLSAYQLVIFLDTRPEAPEQRAAFEQYMQNGGAWIGFHFSAFALTPSSYEQNWPWYHEQFLGSGEHNGNTWKPTAAILQVEDSLHPFTAHFPATFTSAPNEWYRWKNDLRKDTSIKVLLSVHPSSFPLGTGPKPHEIWHSGDYPVAWTNKNYRMLYINMGHNDMDYGGTNLPLSSSFSSEWQNRFITNAVLLLRRKAW